MRVSSTLTAPSFGRGNCGATRRPMPKPTQPAMTPNSFASGHAFNNRLDTSAMLFPSKARPAAKFLLDRNLEPVEVTRDISRLFLGRNVRCAQ